MNAEPNLVLVVFDTARRDVFEPHGAAAGSTPAMAQLASAGAAHQAMYSTASWTVPAHASLFLGDLYRSLGFEHRAESSAAGFRAAMVANRDRHLPTFLQRQGYATAGVSANAWIHRSTGFDVGFDSWRSIPPRRHNGLTAEGWPARARWYVDALRAHLDDGAAAIEQQLDEWARDRDRGQPFFWFVNLVECHSPYLPPLGHCRLSALDRLRSARDARRHQTLEGFWNDALNGWQGDAAALDRTRRQYEGAISLLDAWLARLLELLDRHGVLVDTQVVVTSDHGENLGENRLTGHSFSLDQRLVQVPFATAGPVDLALPTVAGLHDLPGAIATAFDVEDSPWPVPAERTVAVAQFDSPARRGLPTTELTIRTLDLDPSGIARLLRSFASATDGRWKLERTDDGTEVFYDLEADPMEAAPITPQEPGDPERLARLRVALDAAAEAERPRPAATDDLRDRELENQLRLLGYL